MWDRIARYKLHSNIANFHLHIFDLHSLCTTRRTPTPDTYFSIECVRCALDKYLYVRSEWRKKKTIRKRTLFWCMMAAVVRLGCATAAAADSQTQRCLVWLLLPKQSKFTCSRRFVENWKDDTVRSKDVGAFGMNFGFDEHDTLYELKRIYVNTALLPQTVTNTICCCAAINTMGKGSGRREKNNKKYEYFLSFRSPSLSWVFYAFLFVIVCECAIYSLTIWHQRLTHTRKRMRTRFDTDIGVCRKEECEKGLNCEHIGIVDAKQM